MNPIFFCIALNLTFALPPNSMNIACSQAEHLIHMSAATQVSPFVLASLIWHESRWEKDAVSQVKACGLTQILVKYSKYTCKELKKPSLSIREGAITLLYWSKRAKNIAKALACYNSGYKCNSVRYSKKILQKSALLKKNYKRILLK